MLVCCVGDRLFKSLVSCWVICGVVMLVLLSVIRLLDWLFVVSILGILCEVFEMVMIFGWFMVVDVVVE